MGEVLVTLGLIIGYVGIAIGLLWPFILSLSGHKHRNKEKPLGPKTTLPVKTFVVSEYYERMEKVSLEIQEEQEKKEKYYITLWWGLDGLRLYDDDTMEWISRRKQESVNKNISYTPCQYALPPETQNTIEFNGRQVTPEEYINYLRVMEIENAIKQKIPSYQIFDIDSQRFIQFPYTPAYITSYNTSIYGGYRNQCLGGSPYEGDTCKFC